MASHVSLDSDSGCITFGEHLISLCSQLSDLSSRFDRTEQLAWVEGRNVICIFACASHQEGDIKFDLSLRYEQGRLVRAALFIEPKHFRDLKDDAFYGSVTARYSYHTQWLKNSGMPSSSYTEMPWGTVGVARDKSENVFIYLTCQQDTIARSA